MNQQGALRVVIEELGIEEFAGESKRCGESGERVYGLFGCAVVALKERSERWRGERERGEAHGE